MFGRFILRPPLQQIRKPFFRLRSIRSISPKKWVTLILCLITEPFISHFTSCYFILWSVWVPHNFKLNGRSEFISVVILLATCGKSGAKLFCQCHQQMVIYSGINCGTDVPIPTFRIPSIWDFCEHIHYLMYWKEKKSSKQLAPNWGCRRSSVDLFAPSILPPRVWIPSTQSRLFSI